MSNRLSGGIGIVAHRHIELERIELESVALERVVLESVALERIDD